MDYTPGKMTAFDSLVEEQEAIAFPQQSLYPGC